VSQQDLLNIGAVIWFFSCWIGYASFARSRAKTSYSLSSVLQIYRKQWMLNMLRRENRIGDTALIAGLERQTTFLASTSMFIIAGLVTVMASVEQVHATLIALPLANTDMTPRQLQFKILLLLAIYAYAFFTLTWALRQHGFSSILLGAAPLHADDSVPVDERHGAIGSVSGISKDGVVRAHVVVAEGFLVVGERSPGGEVVELPYEFGDPDKAFV
jgi:uncharacterized membrane protein